MDLCQSNCNYMIALGLKNFQQLLYRLKNRAMGKIDGVFAGGVIY